MENLRSPFHGKSAIFFFSVLSTFSSPSEAVTLKENRTLERNISEFKHADGKAKQLAKIRGSSGEGITCILPASVSQLPLSDRYASIANKWLELGKFRANSFSWSVLQINENKASISRVSTKLKALESPGLESANGACYSTESLYFSVITKPDKVAFTNIPSAENSNIDPRCNYSHAASQVLKARQSNKLDPLKFGHKVEKDFAEFLVANGKQVCVIHNTLLDIVPSYSIYIFEESRERRLFIVYHGGYSGNETLAYGPINQK